MIFTVSPLLTLICVKENEKGLPSILNILIGPTDGVVETDEDGEILGVAEAKGGALIEGEMLLLLVWLLISTYTTIITNKIITIAEIDFFMVIYFLLFY